MSETVTIQERMKWNEVETSVQRLVAEYPGVYDFKLKRVGNTKNYSVEAIQRKYDEPAIVEKSELADISTPYGLEIFLRDAMLEHSLPREIRLLQPSHDTAEYWAMFFTK